MEVIYVILALVVLILVLGISTYNSLISKRNDVRSIYSSVEVLLNQRYDLIPNLVASLKEYLKHESQTLENITRLRENALNINDKALKFNINNELSQALKSLNVKVENYPELKASENFLNLQNALRECEEQISAARRAYNSSVNAYNSACESFPTIIIANMFNFKKAEFYEANEQAKINPNVKDLFND